MRRFRWAICQLDILKRLRPDASIIKAALSNLPKTLDETYERIFFAIPQDDWLSVQHVFYWITYHNDIFHDNIPLETLLQAVQQSTLNHLTPYADDLHDFEGLRERCGCLIRVWQNTKSSQPPSTVMFAHYTVKEYLQSPRISHKEVGFFALELEKICNQCAQIALLQALAIEPDPFKYSPDDDESLDIALKAGDIKTYFVVSSALQLYTWPDVISSDSDVMELSEKFVNPHRPTYHLTVRLLKRARHPSFQKTGPVLREDKEFWNIDWHKIPDPKCAIFLSFSVFSNGSGDSDLAVAFAKRHQMLPILMHQLHVSKFVRWESYMHNPHRYDLKGSIPEIIAQWVIDRPHNFRFVLDLISRYGSSHFDLSKVLLLHIGFHNHKYCGGSCSIETLLDLGADVNASDSAVLTPLQIAVACWDVSGVAILLHRGADPNILGGKHLGWEMHSPMQRFNRLHGLSALRIIRALGCFFPDTDRGIEQTSRMAIEERLLAAGATDFVSVSLD